MKTEINIETICTKCGSDLACALRDIKEDGTIIIAVDFCATCHEELCEKQEKEN